MSWENQVYLDATVLANFKMKSFPSAEWAWEGCGFSKEIIQSLRGVNNFMVLIINEAKGKKGMATCIFLKDIWLQNVTTILTNWIGTFLLAAKTAQK